MTSAEPARWLIVNGDDFGLSPGVNRAIIDAHCQGILTSASLMATGDAFGEAVVAAHGHPELSIGLHLALIEGRAVLAPEKIPSLTSADGRLCPTLGAFLTKWLRGRIDVGDVEREWRAQVEKALDAGIRVDKLDSHMHIHLLPGIFAVVLRLAQHYRIGWIRLPKADAFHGWHLGSPAGLGKQLALTSLAHVHARAARQHGVRYSNRFAGLVESGQLTEDRLVRLVQHLRPGVTEVMTHPGYPELLSDAWPQSRRYTRQTDFGALISPRVKNLLKTLGITLLSYREVDHHW